MKVQRKYGGFQLIFNLPISFTIIALLQEIASRGISNAIKKIEVNLLELITLSNSDLFLQSGQEKKFQLLEIKLTQFI